MFEPWRDFVLVIATPVLIVPAVFAALLLLSSTEIGIGVVALGAIGHHLPGMMRAYGDRELFARFKTRFVVAPVFLLAVCVWFAVAEMPSLTLAVLVWGIWHGMAQVYGFARIYDAKVGSTGVTTAWLDYAMCIAWFVLGVVCSPLRLGDLLEKFYAGGGALLTPSGVAAFRQIWLGVTATVTVAFVVHLVRQRLAHRPVSPMKLLMMATSFGFWCYAMSIFDNLILGVAMFEIFHDVQYLAIVWLYSRHRVDRGNPVGPLTRMLFRRSRYMVMAYVGLCLGYGALSLIPRAMDTGAIQRALLGVFAASSLLHFYFDGFIWKVRERATREGLDLAVGSDVERRPTPSWGLGHGLRWGLLVVPLCVLELAPWGRQPELEQRTNLAALVPDNPTLRVRYGIALAESGRSDDAMEQYREASRIDPRDAASHYNLGMAYLERQDLDLAIQSLERATESHPRAAIVPVAREQLGSAYHNRGLLRAERGDYRSAVTDLSRAAELLAEPARSYLNSGLAYIRLQLMDQAAAVLEQAMTSDPGGSTGAVARRNLARIFHQQGLERAGSGRLTEAAALLRRALVIDADSARALRDLGQVLLRLGRQEEAGAAMARAQSLMRRPR